MKSNNYQLSHIFHSCFSCIAYQVATIFAFTSNHSVKQFTEMLSPNPTKKKLVRTVNQKQKKTVFEREKEAQYGTYTALNDWTSQRIIRTNSAFFSTFLNLLWSFNSELFFHNSFPAFNSSSKIDSLFVQNKLKLCPSSSYCPGNLCSL